MAVLIHALRLWLVEGCRGGIDVGLVGHSPIQKILVGLVPPSCSVRRRLELASYLPVAFHDYAPHGVCPQEHSQICGGGNGRGGETSGASPDLDGSCKMCHL